jgi:Flp pilus assembly protein TadG
MIEFGLVFSLLLMLIVGTFELGRAVWTYTTVSYASRQGARLAIVHSEYGDPDVIAALGTDPIDDQVKRNAVGLDPAKLQITKNWTPDASRGSEFQITVRYPVDFIGASLFLPGSNSITVGTSSRFTVLN